MSLLKWSSKNVWLTQSGTWWKNQKGKAHRRTVRVPRSPNSFSKSLILRVRVLVIKLEGPGVKRGGLQVHWTLQRPIQPLFWNNSYIKNTIKEVSSFTSKHPSVTLVERSRTSATTDLISHTSSDSTIALAMGFHHDSDIYDRMISRFTEWNVLFPSTLAVDRILVMWLSSA